MRSVVALVGLYLVTCNALANNFAELFERMNPSVVELHVEALGDPKPGQVSFKPTAVGSLGSGVLINDKGQILTAAHVVDKALKIEVEFVDGTKTRGYIAWVERAVDLAMIQVEKMPSVAKPAPLGDSKLVKIGEPVFVIGAPYGISHTLTTGHLSGRRDAPAILEGRVKPVMLQTDAAINKGNSGGPMFNLDGEVIGIVSSIMSRSGGNEGLGFAVSTETVNDVIQSETSSWGGIISFLIPKEIAPAMNNPYGYGILVQQVIPNTLADKIGLKGGSVSVTIANSTFLMGGDILLEFAGIPLKDVDSVFKARVAAADVKKGQTITVKIWRQGKLKTINYEKD